jgi:hypothetical protein
VTAAREVGVLECQRGGGRTAGDAAAAGVAECRGTVSVLSLESSKVASGDLCDRRGLIFLGVMITKAARVLGKRSCKWRARQSGGVPGHRDSRVRRGQSKLI